MISNIFFIKKSFIFKQIINKTSVQNENDRCGTLLYVIEIINVQHLF